MYLYEHDNKLGGMDVKFIVEDEQGKPDTAVTKAKKLILQDKVHMFIGGLLASIGYAMAPVEHRRKDTLYLVGSCRRRSDAARAVQISVFHAHRAGRARSRTIRLGNGPAIRATRKSSSSQPTMHSATRQPAASRRHSRIAAARSSRKSGRRSAPRISGPTSRPSKADADAIFTPDGRPDGAAVPQAAACCRQQEADHRRRHQLRRVRAAVHGRRSRRRRLGSALQRRAGDAEERSLREGLSRQIRQGAVLLFGERTTPPPR